MQFYTGWHQPVAGPSGCANFSHTMISVNRLVNRRSPFPVQDWILDSGAFSRIASGKGHLSVYIYASQIMHWADNGTLECAVAQDYACDDRSLAATGLSVAEHQALTIERYDQLKLQLARLSDRHPYVMPVLQGQTPGDYLDHLVQYESRLGPNAWVGVGSLCKRSASPTQVAQVLLAIHAVRPDLRLHGFGIKARALASPLVWDLLHSADSMAAIFCGPWRGTGTQNDPLTALTYAAKIIRPQQPTIFSGVD